MRTIARRLCARLPAVVDVDDLVQIGLIGLNDAISRYELQPDATFETYAWRRIEGAMLDLLRADDTLSRTTRSRLHSAQAATRRLAHRLGRTPRRGEIAKALAWPLDKLHRVMVDAWAGARALDASPEHVAAGAHPVSPEGEEDAGVPGGAGNPLRAAQFRERLAALSAAFDHLPDVERYVLESIYDHDRPLRHIGSALGVSEARVSQIHGRIVEKLRRQLNGI